MGGDTGEIFLFELKYSFMGLEIQVLINSFISFFIFYLF